MFHHRTVDQFALICNDLLLPLLFPIFLNELRVKISIISPENSGCHDTIQIITFAGGKKGIKSLRKLQKKMHSILTFRIL